MDRLARGSDTPRGGAVIDYKAVARVGGGYVQKETANRWVDVPTSQRAVLRCNRAVDRVCDLCEVFDFGPGQG